MCQWATTFRLADKPFATEKDSTPILRNVALKLLSEEQNVMPELAEVSICDWRSRKLLLPLVGS